MTKTLARNSSAARQDFEESLRRLKTDHLDLWQMHSVMSPGDVEERQRNGVMEAMEEAKSSGKVRYIGFTGHRRPSAHRRVLEITDQFDTCQMPINAADPSYESFVKNIL